MSLYTGPIKNEWYIEKEQKMVGKNSFPLTLNMVQCIELRERVLKSKKMETSETNRI